MLRDINIVAVSQFELKATLFVVTLLHVSTVPYIDMLLKT
jgi:hypothetical protein